MALPANWTTEVPADKSITEIMLLLKRFGATAIHLDLAKETGETLAVSFAIEHPKQGPMPFRLPADAEAVKRVIAREYNNRNTTRTASAVQKRHLSSEHARNVAWRICKDWLRAQLSLIELEMVSLETVMLPYLLVDGNKPLHKLLAEGNLRKLLTTGGEDIR